MTETQSSVKDVIPDIGGSFTLDANVIKGRSKTETPCPRLYLAQSPDSIARQLPGSGGQQLWDVGLDSHSSYNSRAPGWKTEVVLLESRLIGRPGLQNPFRASIDGVIS